MNREERWQGETGGLDRRRRLERRLATTEADAPAHDVERQCKEKRAEGQQVVKDGHATSIGRTPSRLQASDE
jgi:hypothetical protein